MLCTLRLLKWVREKAWDLTEKQSLRLSQLKIHSGPEPQTSTKNWHCIPQSSWKIRYWHSLTGPYYCIVHRYECTHQGGPCDNVHVQASWVFSWSWSGSSQRLKRNPIRPDVMYFLLAGDKRALHRYARNRRGSVALYYASVCALCAARCELAIDQVWPEKSTGLEKRRRLKDSGRSPYTYIYREWQNPKSQRRCGARSSPPQI